MDAKVKVPIKASEIEMAKAVYANAVRLALTNPGDHLTAWSPIALEMLFKLDRIEPTLSEDAPPAVFDLEQSWNL